MRRNLKIFVPLFLVIVILIAFKVETANAAIYRTYDVIVPILGSNTYTGEVTRQGTSSTAINRNTSIGADRLLYTQARLYPADGSFSDWSTERREIRSGDSVTLRYLAGQSDPGGVHRLSHTNTPFATVRVQARGDWSPR